MSTRTGSPGVADFWVVLRDELLKRFLADTDDTLPDIPVWEYVVNDAEILEGIIDRVRAELGVPLPDVSEVGDWDVDRFAERIRSGLFVNFTNPLAKIAERDKGTIKPADTFGSLGLGAILMFEAIVAIDEQFGIKLGRRADTLQPTDRVQSLWRIFLSALQQKPVRA